MSHFLRHLLLIATVTSCAGEEGEQALQDDIDSSEYVLISNQSVVGAEPGARYYIHRDSRAPEYLESLPETQGFECCGRELSTWVDELVPHAGFICLPTCIPITVYIMENLGWSNTCSACAVFTGFAHGTAGGHGAHSTTYYPSTGPDSFCMLACNGLSQCTYCL